MKKAFPDSEKARKYISKFPKIYLVVQFARYGCLEFPFTGKYKRVKVNSTKNIYKDIPLVYCQDDHNGTYSEWVLCPITLATTGFIYGWYTNRNDANMVINLLNKRLKETQND